MRLLKPVSEVEELVRKFISDNNLDAEYSNYHGDDKTHDLFIVHFAVEKEEPKWIDLASGLKMTDKEYKKALKNG